MECKGIFLLLGLKGWYSSKHIHWSYTASADQLSRRQNRSETFISLGRISPLHRDVSLPKLSLRHVIALDCRYALSFDLSFHLFSPSLRLEVGLLIELRAVVPWICQEYFILFPGLSYLKRDTRQSASERINKRKTVITCDTYSPVDKRHFWFKHRFIRISKKHYKGFVCWDRDGLS